MRVLVVGGAGYIGSQMVGQLGAGGIDVPTLDNLSSGHRDAVRDGDFVAGDIGDRRLLDELLGRTAFDGVMHFAAHIEVGESVRGPAKYYQNNVVNTKVLLDAMREHDVTSFVFSSASVRSFGSAFQPADGRVGARVTASHRATVAGPGREAVDRGPSAVRSRLLSLPRPPIALSWMRLAMGFVPIFGPARPA